MTRTRRLASGAPTRPQEGKTPSLEQRLRLTVYLFGRHKLHAALVEILEPALGFIEPEFIDLLDRKRIEAFKELVRKLCATLGREAQRLSFDRLQVNDSRQRKWSADDLPIC